MADLFAGPTEQELIQRKEKNLGVPSEVETKILEIYKRVYNEIKYTAGTQSVQEYSSIAVAAVKLTKVILAYGGARGI